MKFRCERDVFLEALATAGRAVSSRGGSSPIHSGVKIELLGDRLGLLGSDSELSIEVEVAVAGLVDGVSLVPARLMTDIVRALGAGAVEVEVDGDLARVTAGRSQFQLQLMPPDEFPRPPLLDVTPIDVDARALGQALRQVVPAASSDDSRPVVLTGVLMAAEADGLRLVATDSYRLAQRDVRDTKVLADGQSVLLPSRALGELTRLLNAATAAGAATVAVRLGERAATFDCGRSRLTTRLIDGEFPNYRNLVPTSCPNRLTVGREALLDAVRRVRLLARDSSTPIRLEQSADGLVLQARTNDVGEASESVDAAYRGSDLTVAFNPDFLVAGLEALMGDEITLDTEDQRRPVVLRSPGHDDFLYLLMPVRV